MRPAVEFNTRLTNAARLHLETNETRDGSIAKTIRWLVQWELSMQVEQIEG